MKHDDDYDCSFTTPINFTLNLHSDLPQSKERESFLENEIVLFGSFFQVEGMKGDLFFESFTKGLL